jgi:hypothetical protein
VLRRLRALRVLLPHLTLRSPAPQSYLPVDHIDPASGAYVCGDAQDCNSTVYDGCMADEFCRSRAGFCDAATQARIASFLKCFEGAHANTETQTDPAQREPCFAQAGLDFAPVQQCFGDAARVARIRAGLNASKAAMMARLQPAPGYFPHIFVDGRHQWNNSWCSLTRTLCGLVQRRLERTGEPLPPACVDSAAAVAFELPSSSVAAAVVQLPTAALDDAVRDAVDVATSAMELPDHFDTDDDALPAGATSYVNVRAASSMGCTGGSGGVSCKYSVLGQFARSAQGGCQSSRFVSALAARLQIATGIKVGIPDIGSVSCH